MDRHSETETKHNKTADHAHSQLFDHDVQAAHTAWDAWKSKDPEAWDWALEQREKISKKDPKAWNKAMKEVDAEEAAQKRAAQAEQQRELNTDEQKRNAADRLRKEYLMENAATHIDPNPDLRKTETLNAGYAPQSRFAPESPNSPAFDAAYNHSRGEFYGLDLGIVKLGVQDGSLDAGVNVGIASAEMTLGKNTGVAGEFMPYGGPLHARTKANLGFEDGGIHSEVGAGANFFDLVNGDADFGARLGRHTGVDGDVRAKVWPVNVQADAGAAIGPDGLNAYTGANTGFTDAFGIRSGAQLDLNESSGVGAGVGMKLGDKTLDFGPSIDTYGNRTVRPNLNLMTGNSADRTFYPTGDRDLD